MNYNYINTRANGQYIHENIINTRERRLVHYWTLCKRRAATRLIHFNSAACPSWRSWQQQQRLRTNPPHYFQKMIPFFTLLEWGYTRARKEREKFVNAFSSSVSSSSTNPNETMAPESTNPLAYSERDRFAPLYCAF